MRVLDQVSENISIAIDTLRASKLRSALTILGVIIGVSTVMAMAAIVQGISQQIITTLEVAGPTTFYVVKKFSTTPLNPDRLPKEVRIRPNLSALEAERFKAIPDIQFASIWAQMFGRLEYAGTRTQQLAIFGADDRYADVQGGELVGGRWFTHNELVTGAPVVVLDEGVANMLFGMMNPLDKMVHVIGRPVRVIGVYAPPANIFSPPGQKTGGVVPFAFADHQFTIDKTNGLFIVVKPRPGVTLAKAEDEVTIAMRNMRRLRPGDPSNFDLLSQDQILDIFNKFTNTFFAIMLALSAVSLLVGGIGVMAIMMVSVTDRTREIGVRKALGATRRDILLQFLIEAATLTGIGGLIGIIVGLAFGKVATYAMNIDATTPLTYTLIAVLVSVFIGITFGLLPAYRAARLDPIEALRYE